MKKKVLITILLLSFGFYIAEVAVKNTIGNSNGAPPGYTGSPWDGNNCSACHPHTDSAISTVDWVSHNIPAEGYAHTMSYNFTISIPDSGKKGFELCILDPNGYQSGYLMAGSNSQIIGSEKYITHLAPDSTTPAVWNFQWMPGLAGYGSAELYAAYTVDSNNTYLQQLNLVEMPCVYCHGGVQEFEKNDNLINSFSDGNKIHVTWYSDVDYISSICLCSANGETITWSKEWNTHKGMNTCWFSSNGLNSGIYIITVTIDKIIMISKIFINQ